MKLQYTTRNNRLVVELEADKETDLIEKLASFQEVFEEDVCQKCKKDKKEGKNLKWQVRQDDDENKYYELVCRDCYAKLAFGCHKKGGGVFPKRKGDDGKIKGDYGWVKWNKEKNCEE